MTRDTQHCASHWAASSASGFGLLALIGCVLGCGAADNTRAAYDPPREAQIGITPLVNACPDFDFHLIVPAVVLPGEAALVIVRATDPDSDDAQLSYAWSATSGDFAEPSEPFTAYTCAHSGPQILTATTSDSAGCARQIHLDVTCDEAPIP